MTANEKLISICQEREHDASQLTFLFGIKQNIFLKKELKIALKDTKTYQL